MRRLGAVLVLAVAIAGCGTGSGGSGEGRGKLAIYMSVPLSGERAAAGGAVSQGAKQALADAGGEVAGREIELVVLDDSGGGDRWSPVASAANARRATEDADTIAYIGELDSGATRTSLPITNQAGIPQVSPSATALDLTHPASGFDGAPDIYRPSGKATFARVVPANDVLAQRAMELKGRVGRAPVIAYDGDSRGAAVYVTPFAKPAGAYGAEAMGLILDALKRAGDDAGDREKVIDRLLPSPRRSSPIGAYAISGAGDTTLTEVGVSP
ncbi:MAG: ABC transporter substrate-binding protein [Solirubrobacterales bacterium]